MHYGVVRCAGYLWDFLLTGPEPAWQAANGHFLRCFLWGGEGTGGINKVLPGQGDASPYPLLAGSAVSQRHIHVLEVRRDPSHLIGRGAAAVTGGALGDLHQGLPVYLPLRQQMKEKALRGLPHQKLFGVGITGVIVGGDSSDEDIFPRTFRVRDGAHLDAGFFARGGAAEIHRCLELIGPEEPFADTRREIEVL